MTSVTVVLPMYKPGGNWAAQFVKNRQRLNAFLPQINFSYIVVHDGPVCDQTNNIFEVVQAVCDDVVFHTYEKNRGKGYAWRYGVSKAATPFTLVMDFDFPYELHCIGKVIEELMDGHDIVTGKRDASYFSKLPLKRKVISRSYAFCNKMLLRLPTCDTQSGLKGFNATGKKIFLQTQIDRFLIDTEFLLRAQKNSLNIKVLEIKLQSGIVFSNFGYGVLKTEFKNFLSLIRLQYRLKPEAKPPALQESVFHTYKMAEAN